MAIDKGRADLVKLLLPAMAQNRLLAPNGKLSLRFGCGNLHRAVKAGHIEIVRLLLDKLTDSQIAHKSNMASDNKTAESLIPKLKKNKEAIAALFKARRARKK